MANATAPPCLTVPSATRDESKCRITDAGSSRNTSIDSRNSFSPALSLNSWMTMPTPMAPNTYLAPVSLACPALTMAAQALLSGYGRSASTTSVRRSSVMNRTPMMPPISRISAVCP